MPPNTDHAHNKHNWNIIRNFNQVHVIASWWWILCDPKHVGVHFNVCLLDFYITQILKSRTVTIECISWLIQITDKNDARWKPEIIRAVCYQTWFVIIFFVCLPLWTAIWNTFPSSLYCLCNWAYGCCASRLIKIKWIALNWVFNEHTAQRGGLYSHTELLIELTSYV